MTSKMKIDYDYVISPKKKSPGCFFSLLLKIINASQKKYLVIPPVEERIGVSL